MHRSNKPLIMWVNSQVKLSAVAPWVDSLEALLEALEALYSEGHLLNRRRRVARRKDMAKTVLIRSRTLKPATTKDPRTVTATAMGMPSTNRHNTQAVGVVRSTLVKSEAIMVDLTATSRGSRPLATVDPADMNVMKSVASSVVMSGVQTRLAKVLTNQDNTTQRRKSKWPASSTASKR